MPHDVLVLKKSITQSTFKNSVNEIGNWPITRKLTVIQPRVGVRHDQVTKREEDVAVHVRFFGSYDLHSKLQTEDGGFEPSCASMYGLAQPLYGDKSQHTCFRKH